MIRRILAIDCSNRFTCLGLVDEGISVSEFNLDLGRSQGALLPSCVDSLLKNSGTPIENIDAIGVTVGPGYFTGIRVALSYGIGLAKGLGVPVIPLSPLEALARAARPSVGERVIPCIRAGQGALYCAGFFVDQTGLNEIFAEGERDPEELSSAMSDIDATAGFVVTEERTLVGFDVSSKIDKLICIGGFALGETAWLHRAEARLPHEIQARYYRSPGLGNFSK